MMIHQEFKLVELRAPQEMKDLDASDHPHHVIVTAVIKTMMTAVENVADINPRLASKGLLVLWSLPTVSAPLLIDHDIL